jgi:hypothetical protein
VRPRKEKNIMSQIVLAIDGPSPNVGSGLKPPYGVATTTEDGISVGGTGVGLPSAGITNTTMLDQTVQVIPSTVPVPQVNQETAGVASGLTAPGGIPTTTAMGETIQGTGLDQVQQNATTITNPVPCQG